MAPWFSKVDVEGARLEDRSEVVKLSLLCDPGKLHLGEEKGGGVPPLTLGAFLDAKSNQLPHFGRR